MLPANGSTSSAINKVSSDMKSPPVFQPYRNGRLR
jgi:hypothetical protein